MLHRGIKFVHVAVLLFSAMLSFLFVRGLDEELVLGSSAQVWVTGSDDSVSGGQVARAIAEFADDHEVAVARSLPDVKRPDRLRHQYLASGDSASDAEAWLTDGYPAFGSHVDTAVHPLAEIGQRDPRGFYYVFGPPGPGTTSLPASPVSASPRPCSTPWHPAHWPGASPRASCSGPSAWWRSPR
jgi:hypothetical protein